MRTDNTCKTINLQQLVAVCQAAHGIDDPWKVQRSTNVLMLEHRLEPFVRQASVMQFCV